MVRTCKKAEYKSDRHKQGNSFTLSLMRKQRKSSIVLSASLGAEWSAMRCRVSRKLSRSRRRRLEFGGALWNLDRALREFESALWELNRMLRRFKRARRKFHRTRRRWGSAQSKLEARCSRTRARTRGQPRKNRRVAPPRPLAGADQFRRSRPADRCEVRSATHVRGAGASAASQGRSTARCSIGGPIAQRRCRIRNGSTRAQSRKKTQELTLIAARGYWPREHGAYERRNEEHDVGGHFTRGNASGRPALVVIERV